MGGALQTLVPPVDVDGPRIRLGLAWAALTTTAVAAGPGAAALVFGLAAAPAARQACRTWRRWPRRPVLPVAVLGAAALPVAAVWGPVLFGAVAVVVVVAALVWPRVATLPQPPGRPHLSLTVAVPLLVGSAAAAPVVTRAELGVVPALVLLAFCHGHDVAAFIVGSGAASPWEGWVASVATIAALTLAVAAVLVPPFRGASPWLLGSLAAVLAPLGPLAASTLLGGPRARVPALRRLDVLVVAGPVWAAAAAALVEAPAA